VNCILENAYLILQQEADSPCVFVVFQKCPGKIQQKYLEEYYDPSLLHPFNTIALLFGAIWSALFTTSLRKLHVNKRA
jgi:hypothetical protein